MQRRPAWGCFYKFFDIFSTDLDCVSTALPFLIWRVSKHIDTANMTSKRLNSWLMTLLVAVAPMTWSHAQDSEAEAKEEKTPAVSAFKDKNLEEVVRHSVYEKRNTDEPITIEDLIDVSTIKGRGKNIRDLTGLEHCKSLALLDLAGNQITDISQLAGLKRLQSLDLSNNDISDISALAKTPALQYIEMSHNKVNDLSPLSGLKNMSALYLGYNRIEYIYPILDLPKLSSLHLSVNQVESIEGINNLKWLSSLSLDGNDIYDLVPLDGLNNLNFLFLEYNKVQDISPLITMTRVDSEGEKRFAPFLKAYLKGNRIRKSQVEKLKEYGVRVQY